MSTQSALYTGTTALQAQSAALSLISTNLANTQTTAYKTTDASFKTLVTNPTAGESSGSGVLITPTSNVAAQGLLTSTSNSTDLAIDGDGFFVVESSVEDGEIYYTRAGDFGIDADGYMVNSNGYYLMGWPVDSDGNSTAANNGAISGLEAINLNSVLGSAESTENIAINATLPANADVGDSFTTSSEVFDSLGVSHTIEYEWTKTTTNEWTLNISDPVDSDDTSVTTGTTANGGPYTITFDGDGSLSSIAPSDVEITITGWSTGASDSTIAFDLGTAGEIDGLSQYSNDSETISVAVNTVTQDGLAYGEYTGAYVDEEGMVVAVFDNGQSRPIYQIPLADFSNPNGLEAHTGNAYRATTESGIYILNAAGTSGTGSIIGYSLEASTVDTATELANMIVAQQAYTSASQVISASNDMFDTLISVMH
jgi:flagellar hook protein FlgE